MIQSKDKKCRGTGPAKNFSGCGTMTKYRKYGLCINNCYPKFLLETKEGKKIIERSRIRATKKVSEEKRKKLAEFKRNNKSIRKLIQEARLIFHEYIRIRDANNACISCGSTTSQIWDAGHFKKAELYTGLIFDERNSHKQCRKCNVYLDGNEGEYRKNLFIKFGKEWLDNLDEYANRLRTYKFTREELYEIKETYKTKIKHLTNGGNSSTNLDHK